MVLTMFEQVAREQGHEQHHGRADPERDAPPVVAEVGKREQDHRESETGAQRE